MDEWDQAIAGDLESAESLDDLEAVRIRWLGKKGRLTEALKGLGRLAPEERRETGRRLNDLSRSLTRELEIRQARLKAVEEARRLERERIDMTLPGRAPTVGTLHPVTRVERLVESVFIAMGFRLVDGPEVETVWYNFEALNMPEGHPARAMQDSFFVDVPGMVMRTQTSPMQIRTMEAARGRIPLRIISTGRTYRRDEDATHLPMFTQLEVLALDRGIGLAELKATLEAMVEGIFGPGVGIRLRPSYFPFTEPSLEVDIACVICGGTGCRVCHDGWIEILGSGMVHPHVLANGGYDPETVTGFALGLGIERVAMLLYGFDDARLLYQNDVRFLNQFGGIVP